MALEVESGRSGVAQDRMVGFQVGSCALGTVCKVVRLRVGVLKTKHQVKLSALKNQVWSEFGWVEKPGME